MSCAEESFLKSGNTGDLFLLIFQGLSPTQSFSSSLPATKATFSIILAFACEIYMF